MADSNQLPDPATAPKNGMGITALVLGIIGVAPSWIPIIGFLGSVLGILAIVFGIIAAVRVHTGSATNTVVSYVGIGLGVLALVVPMLVFGLFTIAATEQSAGTTSGSAQPARPTSTFPEEGRDASAGRVVYEVTGSEGVGTITYGRDGATSRATDTELPWFEEQRITGGAESYSLSARNGQNGGEVTCEITLDGEVLARNTADDPHTMVTCNGDTGL